MQIHENVLTTIGRTPLVRLNKVVPAGAATVLVKPEYMNPGGSIKDRMALHIIEKAEKAGTLKPGATIVENTSGNTGVGVALAAAVKGYKCVFTMPDKMSKEKQDTLKAFGAKVIVTPTNVPAESPDSYYSVAKRIAAETPGSFYVNQYHNRENVEAHYRSTGPEIWEQTGGRLDAFVAGIGTGGTMSGAGPSRTRRGRSPGARRPSRRGPSRRTSCPRRCPRPCRRGASRGASRGTSSGRRSRSGRRPRCARPGRAP